MRYDVLYGNGDALASFDVWWEACAYLQDWQSHGYYGSTDTGSIRDNGEE